MSELLDEANRSLESDLLPALKKFLSEVEE